MTAALWIATAVLLAITLLPLSRKETWWIRGWDFPRLQVTIMAVAILLAGGCLIYDRPGPATWTPVAFAAACLAYQLWWIVPYTPLFPVEVTPAGEHDDRNAIKIMASNVLAPNRCAKEFLALVKDHDPDVLVTLETDQWWQDHLSDLDVDYPHQVKCPMENCYGMHLFSKLELSESQVEYLVDSDKPSIHTVVALRSGEKIRAHFLHPAPPGPEGLEKSSQRDAELIVVAKSVADSRFPVIVAGDLNDVAWSTTTRLFRKISGLLDPRVGRGMFNTFHAGHWYMRWPLDHLFHSRHFTLSGIRRLRVIGSDHFALYTELVHTPGEFSPDNHLEADADDRELAERKMAQKNVDESDVPRPSMD